MAERGMSDRIPRGVAVGRSDVAYIEIGTRTIGVVEWVEDWYAIVRRPGGGQSYLAERCVDRDGSRLPTWRLVGVVTISPDGSAWNLRRAA
jgi:hypothetical protein